MQNKKGFTLLELLVVVLIIGILAAIAMPQYRRAVLKSRLSAGIPLTESLFQAEQAYYLAHDEFSKDIDALDFEVPKDDSCEKWLDEDGSGYSCNWGTLNVQGNATSFVFIYPTNRAESD
ncbi:MAG: prepilin-type N-terminal cleavage/methylation domain-containing protein, partial [Elusimicrobiaceae bacterium]|nr:prepilin-type N-terminal cleavage/methylation domain-containing protein [Elusimicrobiaceae bacterium]